MTAISPHPTAVPLDRWRWVALAVVMTAAFMDLVDVTIVNIAVPSIQADLGASSSQIQWTIAGYELAFAVGLITGGRLGDIFGRKRLFLIGVTLFTIASAFCGFAGNPDMLVVGRIMQGAAAALMVPQVLSIAHATFPAHERGKVFGLWGAIVGMGGVCGPLLGALLTSWNVFDLGWRSIFLINLPIGIAAVIIGRKVITESKASKSLRLDLIGTALALLAMLMLLYPLTRGEETHWPLWGHIVMVASIAVFAILVMWERRKIRTDGSPLIELSLFRSKGFSAGIVVQLTFGLVCGMFFLVWTLYMQVGLGWSVLKAGLAGLPFSIAVAAAAGISVGLLVPKFGRKVLQAGALTMAAGMLAFLWMADQLGVGISPWQTFLPLLVIGVGMGLIVAPLTEAVLSDVPVQHSGSASGLINSTLQAGNALGLGLTSVLFFGVLGDNLTPATTGPAFVNAFENSLAWAAGVLVVAALVMFALPKRNTQPPEAMAEEVAEEAPARV